MATDRLTTDQLTIYDLQQREDVRVDVRQPPRLFGVRHQTDLAAGRREFLIDGPASFLARRWASRCSSGTVHLPSWRSRLPAAARAIIPRAVLAGDPHGSQHPAGAVQREQQQILGEPSVVTCRPKPSCSPRRSPSFERPEFHNRLQRVQSSVQQPLNMVYAAERLSSALVGVAGVSIALLAIQPLIIPMVLLVLLPAWMAASRRGSEFWRYFWRMTPKDRERNYSATARGTR